MFAKSTLEMLVPLVAKIEVETCQPLVFSKVTLLKPLQPQKAYEPILVTLSGIVMLFKPLQP